MSEGMLEHNIPSDNTRRLRCLIKGDAAVFTVTVPVDKDISDLKELVHKKGENGVLGSVDAKDLVLLKVDIHLDAHNDDSLRQLTINKNDEGVQRLTDWKPVSNFWLTQPASDRLHIFAAVTDAELSQCLPHRVTDYPPRKKERKRPRMPSPPPEPSWYGNSDASHSFSDRKPENCWGDLDYNCRLCGTQRLFCPGCTGGLITEIGHGDLFMSCLVNLRCPLCVGVAEAYQDKDFWQRVENNKSFDSKEANEYTKMQVDDIEEKYPGWSKSNVLVSYRPRDGSRTPPRRLTAITYSYPPAPIWGERRKKEKKHTTGGG